MHYRIWISYLLAILLNFSFIDGTVILKFKNLSNLTQGIHADIISQQALAAHNCCRSKHGSDPLHLDSSLSSISQKWADHLAVIGRMEHSGANGLGECLFMTGGNQGIANGGVPIYYWYSESKNYNYNVNDMQNAGHFTQVVWKATKSIGFGIASNGQSTYFVANYKPPGNYGGQYINNVSPPNGDASSCFDTLKPELLELEDYEIL